MVNFDREVIEFRLLGNVEHMDEEVIVTDVKLPDDSPARMKVLRAEGRKWYLTVVYHESSGNPFALFCHTNSHDKSAQTSDAISRLEKLAQEKESFSNI